jgi:hypothetical protein
VQANWVKAHVDDVKAVIRSKKLKRRREVGEDVAALDEWCLERTSFEVLIPPSVPRVLLRKSKKRKFTSLVLPPTSR